MTPSDPYAKFGGSAESDPYSKFGGKAEEQPSAASRFFAPLDPRPLVHALLKPSDTPGEDPRATFGKNALGVLKGLADRQVEQLKQAKEAYDKGDYTTAIGHGIYGLAPIIGPLGDDAAKKFESGDLAGGFGVLTSILGPKALHEASPAIAEAAGAAKDAVKGAAVDAANAITPKQAANIGGTVGGVVGGATGALKGPTGAVVGGYYGAKTGAALGRGLRNAIADKTPAPAAPDYAAYYASQDLAPSAQVAATPEPVPYAAAPESPALRAPIRPPLAQSDPVRVSPSPSEPVVSTLSPASPSSPSASPSSTVADANAARALARKLYEAEITTEAAGKLTEGDWKAVAQHGGLEAPNEATVKAAKIMLAQAEMEGPPIRQSTTPQYFAKTQNHRPGVPAALAPSEPVIARPKPGEIGAHLNPKALSAAQRLKLMMEQGNQ